MDSKTCTWCGEPGFLVTGFHKECGVRMAMGSVKCQQGLCERLGGPGCGDEESLTKRQAAKAAFDFYSQNCVCETGSPYCPVHYQSHAHG